MTLDHDMQNTSESERNLLKYRHIEEYDKVAVQRRGINAPPLGVTGAATPRTASNSEYARQ